LILFLISGFALFSQKKKSLKDLPVNYRKWLEEEVVYIISPKEKDVFLQLESDRERDLFIGAFWKQRDPEPNTPDNEFKIEHYRRISYSNQWFGKESPGPGWRTDMGRIYIILGEPKAIEKYENEIKVFPVIIWFYEGMAKYGLPNAFNVVFFKREGFGEYELYSPVKFGPQNLVINYQGDPTDYEAAFNELQNIEPNIAAVSLSLIPGEDSLRLSPSLASEVLINSKIPAASYEKVKDLYAEKFLKYKDFVEVEYSANYIDNESSIKVIQDKSGIFFVHYLVEPKKLSLEQIGKKYKTQLEVNGKISDLNKNTIFQYQRSIPIEFNEDQLNKIKTKLFSFQDMFPLVEGNYKFSLLLKNTTSKEFTSVEADIAIPKTPSLLLGSLILANRAAAINPELKGKNKPFMIDNLQLLPSPRNDFTSQDTLFLFFQILGLTPELRENGSLEYSIFKNETKVHSLIKAIRDYPDRTNFLEKFSLANDSPDYYSIKVSVCGKNKEELLSNQARFYISPHPNLLRPWVLSLPLPSSDNPVYANTLGNQFLNKKDFETSGRLLEEAYRRDPNSVLFTLDFCRFLLLKKEYQKIKNIAAPFLNDQRKYEFLEILGQSSQALGEFPAAISYYADYLAHYGMNIQVLNSLGECFHQIGNNKEALKAWTKSLELNPNQESLKKSVESLKEKK
jgi:GWxTD domain-containing protein